MHKSTYINSLRLVAVLLFIACGSSNLPAQSSIDIKATWQVLGEDDAGKRSISQFVIYNNSDDSVLSSEWSLWFNSMRSIDVTQTTGYKLTHENGDLYRLQFADGFLGIAPGDSIQVPIEFKSKVINFSFAPSGLYLASEDSTVRAIDIEDYQVLPYTGYQELQLNALAEQYDLNQRLAALKSTGRLIIPQPAQLDIDKESGAFDLSPNTTISADSRFEKEAANLNLSLQKIFGKSLSTTASDTTSDIRFVYAAEFDHEAYSLESTATEIVIKAADPAGAFYGVQTLKALFPLNAWSQKGGRPESVSLPLVSIQDAPRFAYRGFMLDIARNFHSKEEILKILDLMATYKLNKFHLHFSDDEGWRLEIKSLPELTEVGSKRSADFKDGLSIQPSYGSGAVAEEKQYLSQADFIEILRFAADRHITVIPEIETPGHARAAIKSMDARYNALMKEGKEREAKEFLLRDFEDKSEYSSAQYWNDNVMNVALPSTFHFIETVIDEIVGMYKEAGLTLSTISLGGDEVPRGVWEQSPQIKTLMERESIKSVNGVWTYYINNLLPILQERNLQMAGWEEFGMVNTGNKMQPNPQFGADNILLDVWNNVAGAGAEDLAYRLANLGYPIVFIPANNFYLDQAWDNTYQEPGHNWATYTDLERSFSFIPLNFFKNIKTSGSRSLENLTEQGKENIVGVKGGLWSEKIDNDNRLEYMLLPRLLALAERAWAAESQWEKNGANNWQELYQSDWLEFAHHVNSHELAKLDYLHGGFNYRIPDAGVKVINDQIHCNAVSSEFTIHYTLDGTEPTIDSQIYTEPILAEGTVKLRVFNEMDRGGKTVTIHN